MNQIPCVPMTNPYMVQQQTTYMPVPQQPKLNAVNIEINNPSVGTQGVGSQVPQYAQPTMPYYTYPQAQVYDYPQAPAQPYYPQYVCTPQAPVMQAPVEAPQVAQAPVQAPVVPASVAPTPAEAPVAVQLPAPVEAPVAPAIQQQNINVPATPVEPTPAPAVPEPVVSTPEVPNAEAKPEIVPSETVAPLVDVNSFIAKLANPDFDVQAAGMEEIADMVNKTPEKATELVDTKVFDSLTNIINFDSSKLEGPTAEQVAAREKIMTGKEVTDAEKELS